ncbi:sensor histidine kinase [Parapusillimonas granuli]|nr:signal transduction histidine kinase [Parapusillimonas granuli]
MGMRRWPLLNSLRLRLLLGTLVWVLLAVLATGWALDGLFRQHIRAQFRAELGMHLDQLIAAVDFDAAGRPAVPAALSDPRFDKPYSGLYWQVDLLGGPERPGAAGALRSRSLWDQALDARAAPDGNERLYFDVAGPNGARLSMVSQIVHPAEEAAPVMRLMVAADQAAMAEPIERFMRMLTLSLGVLAVGLMLAAVGQVFLGLRPLGRLRRELAALRQGKKPQIEGVFPTELQPLVDDFNGVLSLNAEVVSRARAQAGNLAHALKTPLSVLSNAVAGDDTALGRLVDEQVGMARRQVDHHLMRARAAAAMQASGLRTLVDEPLRGLLRVMEKLYADKGLDLALAPCPPGLAFRGEEQDLQEMLGNVLDNACKWARRRIVIGVGADGRYLRFTVDDDGPGLPQDGYEAVFQRGVRADEQAPGSGLGLAIVKDLAGLYGGDVAASQSDLGGLRIVLRLPRID